MPAQTYEKCHKKTVHHEMKKFKKGTLKERNQNVVKRPAEAIAISLSVADQKCAPLLTEDDVKELETKFNKFAHSHTNKTIKTDADITLTNIKNAEKIVKYYLNEKKNANKAKHFANTLYKRVNSASKLHKLPNRIVKETVNVQKLFNKAV